MTAGVVGPVSLAAPPAEKPYFARPQVIATIFAAFPLVTLPIAYCLLFPTTSTARWAATAYLWALGISHFLITFVIYLSSRNLAYFNASPINRVVYFAIPVVIFLYFGSIWLVDPTLHPVAGVLMKIVGVITPLATYTHLGRQSFGVLQILKKQSGLGYSPSGRRYELIYFFVMPVLQAETTFFGDGRFRPSLLTWATIAIAGGLMACIIGEAWKARATKPGGNRAFVVPLVYFFIQSASACLSVADMRLYLAGDAVHYTEYHAIMYPRVVRSELGDGRVDRILGRLRSPAALFYFVLLLGSALTVFFKRDAFGLRTHIEQHGPLPFAVFLNMLNGIFLFHFFVEAFIWKFSNPFYRDALSPLYFKRKPV